MLIHEKSKSLPKTKAQDERMTVGRKPLVLVLPTTPFVKLLGVRYKVSLQVDHVGMSPGVTHFRSSKRERSSLYYFLGIDDNN